MGLPVGPEGAYFVAGEAISYDEPENNSVIDINHPPKDQPGLWCQWLPNAEGTEIQWDGGEKFYDYVEWINYLIDNFLKPWGYTLDGSVNWYGEDRRDTGTIIIENNQVKVEE